MHERLAFRFRDKSGDDFNAPRQDEAIVRMSSPRDKKNRKTLGCVFARAELRVAHVIASGFLRARSAGHGNWIIGRVPLLFSVAFRKKDSQVCWTFARFVYVYEVAICLARQCCNSIMPGAVKKFRGGGAMVTSTRL